MSEVWSDEVPPGGMVCGECGQPVESEPCYLHPVDVSDFVEVAHFVVGAPRMPVDARSEQERGLRAGE